MLNFKEKLEEYFTKLKANPNVLDLTIQFQKKDPKKLGMCLYPRDEKELALANVCYECVEQLAITKEAVEDQRIITKPIAETEFATFIFALIKGAGKCSNTSGFIKDYYENLDAKRIAEFMFDCIVVPSQEEELEKFIEKLVEKYGYEVLDYIDSINIDSFMSSDDVDAMYNEIENDREIVRELKRLNAERIKEETSYNRLRKALRKAVSDLLNEYSKK